MLFRSHVHIGWLATTWSWRRELKWRRARPWFRLNPPITPMCSTRFTHVCHPTCALDYFFILIIIYSNPRTPCQNLQRKEPRAGATDKRKRETRIFPVRCATTFWSTTTHSSSAPRGIICARMTQQHTSNTPWAVTIFPPNVACAKLKLLRTSSRWTCRKSIAINSSCSTQWTQ